MTALKWTFKSNKGEIYKLEKLESMEWQKQGSDALGDARQKLIHIRAPIVHYSEPYYSDGGGDDDSEMMMMVILTTWFMLMMMQTARASCIIRKHVRIIFPKWISIQCILNHIRSNQTKCDQILDRMCNICQGLNFNLWNSLLIPAQLYICCIYCINY